MNGVGTTDRSAHRLNGDTHPEAPGEGGQTYVSQICRALEAVYESRTTNETRKEASIFLEDAKSNEEAPFYGFTLASQRSQPPHIRHYGLSLLEHAIKHNWPDYSLEQSITLREWVLQLAQSVAQEDALFIRNKVAQLWVDVAKRSWAAEWINMDELLVRIWAESLVHKELVATILESLSEDVFAREDPVATLRGTELSRACVNIFTPASILSEHFPSRETSVNVRYGDEGWLSRLGAVLESYPGNDPEMRGQENTCAIKVLAALKASLSWAIPKALVAARCVENICKALTTPNIPIQMASLDALHALYSRSNFDDDDFIILVCPMYKHDSVDLLRKIYRWSVVDASNIDEDLYSLSKKFSELMSLLGQCVDEKPFLIHENNDLQGFLSLLLEITSSDSLAVSIPILSIWVRVLRADIFGDSEAITRLIGPLLELCSQRLIRYESLSADSKDPTYLFLSEDIDTMPERHAFLGNYRRYCVQAVETIVRRKPFEAIYHILGQVDQLLHDVYRNQQQLQVETYSKNSHSYLRVDAQFTVVEAALRGYRMWTAAHGSRPQQDELERSTMETNLETWCGRLLEMSFEDPLIRKRTLQVAVAMSTSALDRNTKFMLLVLKHILMTRPVDNPSYPAYSEAVKDLQNDCTHELQRLAMKMPDYLLNVYDELEAEVNEIAASDRLDDRQKLSFYSFLFTITHRSTTIDQNLREQRLRSYVDPIKQSWQNPELEKSLESFSSFCDLAGVSKVQEYLVSRRAHEIDDWSTYQLDDEGKAIQAGMVQRFQQLPLKPTKVFLGASLEKVKKGTEQYERAISLWHDAVPLILPHLLKFLRFSHAYHNSANWTGLPGEMKSIVDRLLMDRFWQAGISTGSKDDFYARVSGTKTTLEGFASSVRSTIRTIREACYSMLYSMTKLESHFYGYGDLPVPLAEALFSDAKALSSHQLSTMMSMVRYIVDDCPVSLREKFLPPVLTSLFMEIDAKVNGEWEKLGRSSQATNRNDNLTEEMKEESILRQLTYASVLMVAALLDPSRTDQPESNSPRPNYSSEVGHPHPNRTLTQPDTMRAFVLSSLPILRPLLLFCTHALQMRDSRCCGIIIRVFRSITPDFTSPTSPTASAIREYICSDVLKAAITSLNDPYFVDLQKDLAQFIATIYTLYNVPSLSNTPHSILLSLPGITEQKLDRTAKAMFEAKNLRQLRALLLDLLEGVRGVSVSEQGRIAPRNGARKSAAKERSAMQTQFMHVDDEQQARGKNERSPDLGGVADMLG
ncbi:MAG: hypothetical protein M1837_002027 [Sclerophora amabilis]|nr:MAG: hypothetical protein M1837_002027 [Sclerophora amabilis]